MKPFVIGGTVQFQNPAQLSNGIVLFVVERLKGKMVVLRLFQPHLRPQRFRLAHFLFALPFPAPVYQALYSFCLIFLSPLPKLCVEYLVSFRTFTIVLSSRQTRFDDLNPFFQCCIPLGRLNPFRFQGLFEFSVVIIAFKPSTENCRTTILIFLHRSA